MKILEAIKLNEIIIKSKSRVQKHGEVFTPKKVVNDMLNLPGVKEASEDLLATFLEPSAGEGAFLVAILKRKLDMVEQEYNNSLSQYENYSLLALSTIYGIELLEDNAQNCTMNLFQIYYEKYQVQLGHHNAKSINKKVLDSAKLIIASNIAQGNFLTRRTLSEKPIIINEWSPINLSNKAKNIKIIRTEYTLDEIYKKVKKESGSMVDVTKKNVIEQLTIFDEFIDPVEEKKIVKLRYRPSKIMEIYKEEMEEIDEI